MFSNTNPELQKDIVVPEPPEDSISDLAFSPQADLLAVSSWDKRVRIYEVQPSGQTLGKALYEHDAPVLSCCWSRDGSKIASGGADKYGRVFDIASGQSQQVAMHDAAIRCIRFIDATGANQLLVTGSWDKTLRYWDLRQQQPIAMVQLPEKCYTMDVMNALLVIGSAERHISIINLSNPATIFRSIQSPLKWQTRTVACFPNASGYAVGSIEGRCAIQYVEEKDAAQNFSFKCHRDINATQPSHSQVFSVNSISFHPQHGTFSTAGSDGTFNFWDKDSKHRLKGYSSVGGSISCTAFNRNGSIFAYAISYDWSKGYQYNTPRYPNKILLHPTRDEEIKPRPKQKSSK